MGIFGDIVRLHVNVAKGMWEECGFKDAAEEVKDVFRALKGD